MIGTNDWHKWHGTNSIGYHSSYIVPLSINHGHSINMLETLENNYEMYHIPRFTVQKKPRFYAKLISQTFKVSLAASRPLSLTGQPNLLASFNALLFASFLVTNAQGLRADAD